MAKATKELIRVSPLHGLRITALQEIELRLPNEQELAHIAIQAFEQGIYDPAVMMPWSLPWAEEKDQAKFLQEFMNYHLKNRIGWSPEKWNALSLGVFYEGEIVGFQEVINRNFKYTRAAMTASWLTKPSQGKGIGTVMRAAVLYFFFESLGAKEMYSAAFTDNKTSLAVSKKLGYRNNGTKLVRRGEGAAPMRSLKLTAAQWRKSTYHNIRVYGEKACLPLFGV